MTLSSYCSNDFLLRLQANVNEVSNLFIGPGPQWIVEPGDYSRGALTVGNRIVSILTRSFTNEIKLQTAGLVPVGEKYTNVWVTCLTNTMGNLYNYKFMAVI